jgi:integrase
MSVYQKKTGIYFVQFDYKGTTYIKSSGSRNIEDAKHLETKMRQELAGTASDNAIFFHSAIDQYLHSQRKSASIKNYTAIAKWIKKNSNNILLSQLDSKYVEQLMDKKDASAGTMYQYRSFLLQVFKYSKVDMEIKPYTVKNNRLRYLNQMEEQLLLNTLIEQGLKDEYDLCIMLLDTGARLNEIVNLDWKDIDMDQKTVSIYRSKVDNESVLYMTDRMYSVLSNRTELFGNMKLTKLRTVLNELFDDVNLHTLRHTNASRLIQNGLSIYETSKILGHSNIATTLRYAHLDTVATFQKAATVLNSINQ